MLVKEEIPDHPPAGLPILCRRSGYHSLYDYVLFCFLFMAAGCQTEVSPLGESNTGLKKATQSVADSGANKSKKAPITPVMLETVVERVDQSIISKPPATGEEAEKSTRSPVVSFFNDHDALELPEYTDAQLHKNSTLILLAAQPDLRARKILKPISQSMSDSQKTEAIKLILAQDHKFLKLVLRRSEILEHAQNGDDIECELRRIDAETVAISRMLQSSVLNTVRQKQNQ